MVTPEAVQAAMAKDAQLHHHLVMPRRSSAGFSPWCGRCGLPARALPGTASSWVHAVGPRRPQ